MKLSLFLDAGFTPSSLQFCELLFFQFCTVITITSRGAFKIAGQYTSTVYTAMEEINIFVVSAAPFLSFSSDLAHNVFGRPFRGYWVSSTEI